MRRWRRRTRVEWLRDRSDVRRLTRLLSYHDWVVDRDGHLVDLGVGRRIEVVTALGAIGDPAAHEAILRGLEDDDPRVRRASVEALGPYPSDRAARTLAAAAARWRQPDLEDAHQAAVDLLVGLADELNAVEYAQALLDDRQRDSLAPPEQLAAQGLFAADSGPATESFAEHLVATLGAGDETERGVAQQLLVALGGMSVEPLVAALQDPARRVVAAAALGAIRDTRAVSPLLEALTRGDRAVRAAAARALGEIRDPSALEALVEASGDPDPAVRDAALEAIDAMPRVVATLGTRALTLDEGGDAPPPPRDDSAETQALREPGFHHRSLLQRLLGR
jgi:hypothetical protein